MCALQARKWLGVSPPRSDSTQSVSQLTNATVQANASNAPTLYRDPRTGELYEQVVQTIDQPVTQWQRKVVERTVVTPQQVIENVQVPHRLTTSLEPSTCSIETQGLVEPVSRSHLRLRIRACNAVGAADANGDQQVPATKMIARTEQVPSSRRTSAETQKVNQVTYRKLPPTAAPSAGCERTARQHERAGQSSQLRLSATGDNCLRKSHILKSESSGLECTGSIPARSANATGRTLRTQQQSATRRIRAGSFTATTAGLATRHTDRKANERTQEHRPLGHRAT